LASGGMPDCSCPSSYTRTDGTPGMIASRWIGASCPDNDPLLAERQTVEADPDLGHRDETSHRNHQLLSTLVSPRHTVWNRYTGLVEDSSACEDWCPRPERKRDRVRGPGAHSLVVREGQITMKYAFC